MKEHIIAANWKEHMENSEAASYLYELKQRVHDIEDTDIIIAPSHVSIVTASDITGDSKINIAAQNIFYEDSGAFTGEVSAPMVKNFCNYAIIGHSERRIFFNETNESVRKKLHAASRHGITPILCVGESKEQRERNETFQVIDEILGVLDCLRTEFIVAYEPVWAISRGNSQKRPATPEDAEEAHGHIRMILEKKFGQSAHNVKILYGGSVKPENIDSLMEKKDIDGALVGSASLDVDSFERILRFQRK